MPVRRASQVNSRPNFALHWQFLPTWISRSASKNRVVILWLRWSLKCMSTIAAFDITVRNWGKNLRSLSWWPWNQAPTWTLCPSLTIQITSLCMPTHLSWSFLTLPSITCHRSTLLGVTLLAHFQSNACSSLVWLTIYFVSQIASLPGVEISHVLVCLHRRNLRLLSVIFCLFQLSSWQELLAQINCLPSLRQQCYVFLRHANLSKMVALNMAAMELMVLAGCSCVFVWAF